MNLYGLFIILYMVFYVFNVCDSKCDEYVIVFQEISCGNSYNLKPTKLDQISWEHLTYPYNTTEVYKEVQGYKECILEFDCNGQYASCLDKLVATNYSTHTSIADNNTMDSPRPNTEKPEKNVDENAKPEKTLIAESDDNMMVNLSITYINEKDIQNSSDFTDKKNIILCDHWEIICINEKQLENNSLISKENDIDHDHQSKRTLFVTIQRDLNTTIQPIYTGYFPQLLENLNTTEVNFKDYKIVTFTCELLDNNYCKENKSNKQINVYLKTNYIQNNITTYYPNCTKDSSITNGSLNLNCDGKNFAHYNQQILLPPLVSNEAIIKSNNQTSQEAFSMGVKDLLICKCQIATELNNIGVHINDSNVISFKNCSNYRNIKNESKSRDLDITPNEDNKNHIIDKSTITNSKVYLPSINEDKIITIRITENGDNCSHSSPFSIHTGKITDLGALNSKKLILEHNNVVLNISKCININSTVLHNTETQIDMAIVLKNDSVNTSEVFDENTEEADVKKKVILQCGLPHFNSKGSDANKTILQCESIYLEDFRNIKEVNNIIEKKDTPNATEIGKEIVNCTGKYPNETQVNTGETEKNNCNFNETVAPKHNNNQTRNNSTKDDLNEKIDNDTLGKGNPDINLTFNRKKDKAGLGRNRPSLESNGHEKIIIIVLCSLAAACSLVLFTLKKCGKKPTYHPTPTREAPVEEDTAL